jgi:hypothetical protein
MDNAVVCVKCGVATDIFREKAPAVGDGVLAAGYVFAFLMPLIGGIIGLYTLIKERPGHGIAIMALSLTAFVFWAAVISGG